MEKSYLKTTNTSQHKRNNFFFCFFSDVMRKSLKKSRFFVACMMCNKIVVVFASRVVSPNFKPFMVNDKFLSREMTDFFSSPFVTFLKRIGKR